MWGKSYQAAVSFVAVLGSIRSTATRPKLRLHSGRVHHRSLVIHMVLLDAANQWLAPEHAKLGVSSAALSLSVSAH
jgi:hypothetical protein